MRKNLIVALGVLALVAFLAAILGGCAQRERIAINAGKDCYIHSGADLVLYSDEWSTQTMRLYGDSGNIDAEGTLDVAGAVLSSAGAVTVTDSLNVTGTADFDGVVIVGTFARAEKATAQSLSDDFSLVPTGTYQPVSASAAAGGVISTTGRTAGDLLVVINTGTNTVTITDTGTMKLAGNAALGQYDSLMLIFDGTNWVEIARADN